LRKKEAERIATEKTQARGKFDRSQAFKHPLKESDQRFIPSSGVNKFQSSPFKSPLRVEKRTNKNCESFLQDVRGADSRQTFVVAQNVPKKVIPKIRDEIRSEQGLAFSIDFDDKEN